MLAALFAGGACASLGDPPGGPPDTAPPKIVHVQPESGAVVPKFNGDLVVQFDEVIDEMPGSGGGGTGSLARQVLLSPVAGNVKVTWHRSSISVKPREGWKPRVYRLEVLPGIMDLRRNRFDTARVVLFSRGPEIGHARIGGIALGWVDQRIISRALIEAVPAPDTVGYLTLADSGGQFNLEGLSPGRYTVYATADENGDRARGLREAYDSTVVTLDSSANVALYAFVHDTVAPKLRTATYGDSLSVRLEFSQVLDPKTALDSASVRVLQLPDSVRVPIARILSQRQYDSITTAERQRIADSVKAAAPKDTTKRDTAKVAPPSVQAPAARGRRPGAQAPAQYHVDTALVRKLLALRAVPTDRVVVILAQRLKPETRYVIDVRGTTNLTGRKGGGQVVMLVPKPVPPDTSHAPRRPPVPPAPPPP